MSEALNDIQVALLRLASRTELPSSQHQRSRREFLDIELLKTVGLIQLGASGFTITEFGAAYLRRIEEARANRASA